MDFMPEVASKRDEVVRFKGSVAFDRVTFAYGPGAPAVIDDLGLSIRAGEYVAIVGATGCGKSTLVRLMLGFEHPQHGGSSSTAGTSPRSTSPRSGSG